MKRPAAITVVALIAVTGCGESDTDDALAETAPTVEVAEASVASDGFFQPVAESEETDQGPFWQTTFEVSMPAGHWEEGTADGAVDPYCIAIDEASYRVVTDQGVTVAPFGREPLSYVTFGRSNSIIEGDTCHLEAATMGDFNDDLGDTYTVTNGVLEATFTPEEFFSGQGAGVNTRKPLTPLG